MAIAEEPISADRVNCVMVLATRGVALIGVGTPNAVASDRKWRQCEAAPPYRQIANKERTGEKGGWPEQSLQFVLDDLDQVLPID